MILNKCWILLLLFLLFTNFGQAQPKPFSVSEDLLRNHITFLASDSLQGRKPGTPGLIMAAKYLQREAQKTGLEPGSPDYFQSFELISSRPDLKNSFSKNSGTGNNLTDSLICMNQYNELLKISGEVVLAGFGFEDEKSEYNDLKNVDVEDKIVICATGSPDNFKNSQ